MGRLTRALGLVLATALCCLSADESADLRTWRSKDGKAVAGVLELITSDRIKIRLENGKLGSASFAKLAPADQRHVALLDLSGRFSDDPLRREIGTVVIPAFEAQDVLLAQVLKNMQRLYGLHSPSHRRIEFAAPLPNSKRLIACEFTDIPFDELLNCICLMTQLEYWVADGKVHMRHNGAMGIRSFLIPDECLSDRGEASPADHVKAFFAGLGVPFPDGSSVDMAAGSVRATVHNTLLNLKKLETVYAEVLANSKALARIRGRVRAEADLAKGVTQILYYGKPWSAGKALVDDETKLPVKVVSGCAATAELVAETDAYNATMRNAVKLAETTGGGAAEAADPASGPDH